jgi:hypothetical protein
MRAIVFKEWQTALATACPTTPLISATEARRHGV